MRFQPFSFDPAIRAEATRLFGAPCAAIIAGMAEWGAGECANDARYYLAVARRTRIPENRARYLRGARLAAEAARQRTYDERGRRRAH